MIKVIAFALLVFSLSSSGTLIKETRASEVSVFDPSQNPISLLRMMSQAYSSKETSPESFQDIFLNHYLELIITSEQNPPTEKPIESALFQTELQVKRMGFAQQFAQLPLSERNILIIQLLEAYTHSDDPQIRKAIQTLFEDVQPIIIQQEQMDIEKSLLGEWVSNIMTVFTWSYLITGVDDILRSEKVLGWESLSGWAKRKTQVSSYPRIHKVAAAASAARRGAQRAMGDQIRAQMNRALNHPLSTHAFHLYSRMKMGALKSTKKLKGATGSWFSRMNEQYRGIQMGTAAAKKIGSGFQEFAKRIYGGLGLENGWTKMRQSRHARRALVLGTLLTPIDQALQEEPLLPLDMLTVRQSEMLFQAHLEILAQIQMLRQQVYEFQEESGVTLFSETSQLISLRRFSLPEIAQLEPKKWSEAQVEHLIEIFEAHKNQIEAIKIRVEELVELRKDEAQSGLYDLPETLDPSPQSQDPKLISALKRALSPAQASYQSVEETVSDMNNVFAFLYVLKLGLDNYLEDSPQHDQTFFGSRSSHTEILDQGESIYRSLDGVNVWWVDYQKTKRQESLEKQNAENEGIPVSVQIQLLKIEIDAIQKIEDPKKKLMRLKEIQAQLSKIKNEHPEADLLK